MKRITSAALSVLLIASRAALPAAEAPAVAWVEAERYAEQRGSTAAAYALPAASGGACVDNDWGGQAGHFLRYPLAFAAAMPALHVTLRYARATAGDAVVRVTLDGDTNHAATVRLPSTGDWGFKAEGWQYAAVELPACAGGAHTLELRSVADRNNVNWDGFYVSAQPLETGRAAAEPPSGPDAVAALGEGLFPLPCRTPVALPYARRKAYVDGCGRVQALLSTPEPGGMGRNVAGPGLHVKLAGCGPWSCVAQTLLNAPAPAVVTRLTWPDVEVEQTVFAAAPAEQGFFVRVLVTNRSAAARAFTLVSLLTGAEAVETVAAGRLASQGRPLLRALPSPAAVAPAADRSVPGPLGGAQGLRHILTVAGGASAVIDLQFLGDGPSRDEALAAAAAFWRETLAPAARLALPDPKLQLAFDASLRQMLTLIEGRPGDARILKGLEHYYGSNPYDTFQVSRALDAVGLRAEARTLLRHQLRHLKEDGIFEMWETGNLRKAGAEQWIVQGLAAAALWGHYERWGDEAWLREMAPALVKAAQATLRARQAHGGVHRQGAVDVEGWLPPLGGDGGLGVGYHWSQNAGPLYGVRVAAEAARKLNLPEAADLRAGWLAFKGAYDRVRTQAAQADASGMLAAFPGATGAGRLRPLWGVVMSVSAFAAIPADDPAALKTLRFLQAHRQDGLHLNLGYSSGVWPYLSAEVALWHLRLGETEEAWRILRALADRASATVCWYEEIDHAPPRGHGDSADVWAAAEMVYLASRLLSHPQAKTFTLDGD